MTGKRPVSLYIHVPFCTKKCPYCHFFVLPDSPQAKDIFVSTLLEEWKLEASSLKAEGDEIISIYFGGGTPSLLSPLQIETILNSIRQGPISLSSSCEITLEANPERISRPLMEEFSKVGINRVSVGVQSLEDRLLSLLGRVHNAEKAKRALYDVREAGIENISLDLMYEVPGQTLEDFSHTLQQATELPITHVSLYNLTFEPGTLFYKRRNQLFPSLPSAEEGLAQLNLALAHLTEHGFSRYEISAFAKPSCPSVHNTGYWTGRPFLGLGPSAFSYLSGRRFQKLAHLNRWQEKVSQRQSAEGFSEQLPLESRQRELLAVHLRLLEGVSLPEFERAQGPLSPSLQEILSSLVKEDLLERRQDRLLLTSKGLQFYDNVAAEIV